MKLRGWTTGKFGGRQCHVPRTVDVSGTIGKGLVCLTFYADLARRRRIDFLIDRDDAEKIGAALLEAARTPEVSNGN
jgi:hypothetical protein